MNIHFIGIGGIGVWALAKYYLSQGAQVSGSDLVSSEITEELAKLGAKITIGNHKKTNIPNGAAKVIYTAALDDHNPELREAKRRKLKVQSYPEAIAELTKKYTTITISGAHGKSTTTALVALILEEGYFDPTVIIGTKVKEFGDTNFRRGYGKYLVLEADEWNKSFLLYSPQIAVITNIDAEHLDTYKNVSQIEKTFQRFLEQLPADGAIIANYDDERLRKVAKHFQEKVKWYSLQDPLVETVRRLIKIPGEHNVSNALAAVTLGRYLGIREPAILHALSRFSGTWRRFEFKGILEPVMCRGFRQQANGVFVFADYAHHPAEIRATIIAARQRFPFRRIWCVYQPHQYQRLSYLWNDFVTAFDGADRICLLPVYQVAGRENKKAKVKVSSANLNRELLKRGKNTDYCRTFPEAAELLTREARPGDVVLIMGAGDIYRLFNVLPLY